MSSETLDLLIIDLIHAVRRVSRWVARSTGQPPVDPYGCNANRNGRVTRRSGVVRSFKMKKMKKGIDRDLGLF